MKKKAIKSNAGRKPVSDKKGTGFSVCTRLAN